MLRLAQALEQLPDEYRTVLVLRHMENKTHADIAEQLEKSPTATRMLWVRALAALKKEYGKDG